jgi:hypothetical protein
MQRALATSQMLDKFCDIARKREQRRIFVEMDAGAENSSRRRTESNQQSKAGNPEP